MASADLFRLDGQTAIITGGSRGIGKTIAEALAEAGARVVITARRAEWLAPTEAELAARGLACRGVLADVTRPEDAERVLAAAVETFGQVDILVNNAGQSWGAPTEEYPLEKWHAVLEVNLTGMFVMSQAIGRHLLARGSGRILNVASVAGIMAGDPETTLTIAYNTSKAGVIAFTRTLAMEWGRRGVLVNAIAPGWFPTRMSGTVIQAYQARFEGRTALGRVGSVAELKGAAVFLVSPAASYITGQTLVVDGGISL